MFDGLNDPSTTCRNGAHTERYWLSVNLIRFHAIPGADPKDFERRKWFSSRLPLPTTVSPPPSVSRAAKIFLPLVACCRQWRSINKVLISKPKSGLYFFLFFLYEYFRDRDHCYFNRLLVLAFSHSAKPLVIWYNQCGQRLLMISPIMPINEPQTDKESEIMAGLSPVALPMILVQERHILDDLNKHKYSYKPEHNRKEALSVSTDCKNARKVPGTIAMVFKIKVPRFRTPEKVPSLWQVEDPIMLKLYKQKQTMIAMPVSAEVTIHSLFKVLNDFSNQATIFSNIISNIPFCYLS